VGDVLLFKEMATSAWTAKVEVLVLLTVTTNADVLCEVAEVQVGLPQWFIPTLVQIRDV
jgi:hypothetical protein